MHLSLTLTRSTLRLRSLCCVIRHYNTTRDRDSISLRSNGEIQSVEARIIYDRQHIQDTYGIVTSHQSCQSFDDTQINIDFVSCVYIDIYLYRMSAQVSVVRRQIPSLDVKVPRQRFCYITLEWRDAAERLNQSIHPTFCLKYRVLETSGSSGIRRTSTVMRGQGYCNINYAMVKENNFANKPLVDGSR